MLKGIDVSKWQGNIDFAKVKADGISFVIIRCGIGSSKDSYFEANYKNAKAAGLQVGTYFYAYAKTPEQAAKEAECCINIIKGKSFDLPVFYDLEENSIANTGKANILAIAKAFTEKVKSAGFNVGIYANLNWNKNYLTDKWYDTLPRWIAQYNSKCTYTGKYDIWQYSSTGKVSGISGNVDMNYCYTDFSAKTQTTAKTETDSFFPPRGYFKKGDSSANVGKIASFMRKTFPAYTDKKALGNYYGDYIIKSITEFQRRTGLEPDGCIGPLTLAMLERYGFKK
ncbi:MAG: hypothetical protein J1F23_08485 [Oscillospiraceae bacterium]|nr:hypothetical protein [Oscillospiraceae bacterium]